MVSTNTSNIPRHPCECMSCVREDACAVGEVPHPASLDNNPLLTPKRIDEAIPYPIKPEAAHFIENASLIIKRNIDGISRIFVKII